MEKLYRHPWLNILIILGLSLFFALQLPKVELDNDILNFVPADHPQTKAYERTIDLFGSSMILGVGIEFERDGLFTAEHIQLVRDLTKHFGEFKHVESVLSLTNADYIEGTPEGMRVEPLFGENFEATQDEFLLVKKRLADWDMYRGTLYSADYSSAQIVVTMEEEMTDEERSELYFKIEDEVSSIQHIPIKYYIAGNPAITVLISHDMQEDMIFLIPMVVLVVMTALFISFRKISGVLITMITVTLSTIWTIGAMALLNFPLSMVATAIPVLMIAVGSAYGIHIISHYYDELRACRPHPSFEEHRRIILRTLEKVARPVLMAGLTTLTGFGALSISRVVPMKIFGIFTAFGVLSAVIVALVFIPSLLLVKKTGPADQEKTPAKPQPAKGRDYKTMLAFYHFFSARKIRILLLALLIAIVGIYGSSQMIRDNAIIEYFEYKTPIRQADRFLREKFSGTEFFDIVVRGEKKGDLAKPEILKAMDDLAAYLENNFPEVSRVDSFADFIKRMNQVMNYPPQSAEAGAAAGTSAPAPLDTTSTPAPPESDLEAEDSFGGDFGGGFEGGFSVQADTSEGSGYTDEFFSGSALWQENLQPVDFSKTLTYGDLALLMNKIFTGSDTEEMSVQDFVQELKRHMNYHGAAYYEIPYNPAKYPAENREELSNLIAQYLLLYSGSLDEWADDALEPRQVRMTVQLLTTGSRETIPVLEAVDEYVADHFPAGYRVETSGSALIKNTLTDLLIDAQTLSILISLTLVFLIVAVNFRSLIAGIFGVIPLAFAIIINFAVMGFTGIKLDISTAMVASVAIGIGIDYSIHFMSNYHFERVRSADIEHVTVTTLHTTGKAIIINAFAVAAGFLVLLFSNFNPLKFLGMLIALTMFTSSVASMTLLPVMLNIFKPKFISKPLVQMSTGGSNDPN